MKYAIIEIKGKQFTVEPGQKIVVDRMDEEVGKTISLDKVLLVHDGDSVSVGTPYLEKAGVSVKVLDHSKGEKIRVAKFKSKSKYRRVKGHRQHQTTLEVVTGASSTTKKTKKKETTKTKSSTKKTTKKKTSTKKK